jgi:hypothetical protein
MLWYLQLLLCMMTCWQTPSVTLLCYQSSPHNLRRAPLPLSFPAQSQTMHNTTPAHPNCAHPCSTQLTLTQPSTHPTRSLLPSHRVVYGLARLQLHLPALLPAVEAATAGQLSRATPQVLSGLAVGLSHWGYRPQQAWIQQLCMHAFGDMNSFSAQVGGGAWGGGLVCALPR